MRYFIQAFAALALVAVLTTAPAAPAWADDRSDCVRASGDVAIAACTRLIESGRLSTKHLVITYFNRGNAYMKKRQNDRAIADYTKIIELKPDDAGAYNNRGTAYDNKRQYDRAFADYTRAIELKPDNAAAYNNRGNAYRRKRQYDRAIADYTRAIELEPDKALLYYNRALVYEKTGRKDLAIADYRKGQQLAPNNPNYAKALKRLGAAPTTASACVPPFATYQSSFGKVHFRCRGPGRCTSLYTGTGDGQPARLIGVFTRDCRFKGHWVEQHSLSRCDGIKGGTHYWGKVLFQFDPAGKNWTGWWSYCNGSLSRTWDGGSDTATGSEPPDEDM